MENILTNTGIEEPGYYEEAGFSGPGSYENTHGESDPEGIGGVYNRYDAEKGSGGEFESYSDEDFGGMSAGETSEQGERGAVAAEGAAGEPGEGRLSLTQADVDEIVRKRLERERRQVRRQFQDHEAIVGMLQKAGEYGAATPEGIRRELESKLRQQGIETTPRMDPRDEYVLADSDANEIISEGPDAISDQLASFAARRDLSGRERILCSKLTDRLELARGAMRLAREGVDIQTELSAPEFLGFAAKLSRSVPLDAAYRLFKSLTGKREAAVPPSIGSVKSSGPAAARPFYTREEVDNMSRREVAKNFHDIEASMRLW